MTAKSPNTHTPGPWKVKDIFRDNGPNIIGIFGPRSATSGFNGHCVAHVAHSRDAALIAAAPELLEACALLSAALHYHGIHDCEGLTTYREILSKRAKDEES